MSKKLIAGAGVVASFAIALAPLATFATPATVTSDEHTDQLDITVLPTCSFGSAAAEIDGFDHNEATEADGTSQGTASWSSADTSNKGRILDKATGTLADADKGTDTATYSIAGGTKEDAFATTTFTVVCNNAEGWTVKATANALALAGDSATTIPASASYGINASGYAINKVEKTGTVSTFTVPTGTTITAPNETVIAQNTAASAEDGDIFTVTYGIGVKASQKAGTYSGTVVYSLYQGV